MLQNNTKTTTTPFALLAKGLQDGMKTHKVKDPELTQYLDCKGCGKID